MKLVVLALAALSSVRAFVPMAERALRTARFAEEGAPAAAQQRQFSRLRGPADGELVEDDDGLEASIDEMIELPEGGEKAMVVKAFMQTLPPNVKVTSVSRIQCLSMWQSYAVKRQSILALGLIDSRLVAD